MRPTLKCRTALLYNRLRTVDQAVVSCEMRYVHRTSHESTSSSSIDARKLGINSVVGVHTLK